jgi:hypothetical protein
VDAVTLDHTLAELRPLVVGRHLSRPRLAGGSALAFEVSGSRDRWLWLDAGRGTAGVYWLPREAGRALAEASPLAVPGRARQALLHVRKHVDGARVVSLVRVPGERFVVLEGGGSTLTLRLGGPAPALSLVREGAVLGSLGEGPDAWPPPPPSPEREWDRLDPPAFEAAVAAARAGGRSLVRAVLFACPGLGPGLAREVDGSAGSLVALRAGLLGARPTLLVPAPPGSWHDALLSDPAAVALTPLPREHAERTTLGPSSWLEAGALFLEARRRGLEFDRRRRAALDEARRRIRRLEQLEGNLERDLAGLPDETGLRLHAEALLAFARGAPAGRDAVQVPDPYDAGGLLSVSLDPRLGGLANAERMFGKARRVERARRQVGMRLRETRSALASAREREAQVLEARDLGDLGEHGTGDEKAAGRDDPAPRHYLTGRGLSILVGRNARENHHLTFRVAGAEDLWLHAREAPGAHVILRDTEGRAGADDLREAAEVAAFFSEARGEALVDVHVTRRKHVKPAKGGPGRVFVVHSDTLRVPPRDPEGRLRKR